MLLIASYSVIWFNNKKTTSFLHVIRNIIMYMSLVIHRNVAMLTYLRIYVSRVFISGGVGNQAYVSPYTSGRGPCASPCSQKVDRAHRALYIITVVDQVDVVLDLIPVIDGSHRRVLRIWLPLTTL
jgi:hypothetical protein